jgi:DEAD/DEAH box helicase domain-containing protein
VKTDIKFLQEDGRDRDSCGVGRLELVIGDILVRTQATKYKKLKFFTHENVGYGDIHLPADEMHTRSVVLLFGDGTAAGRAFAGLRTEEQGIVIQKLGALIRNVAPVFLLCDPRDIGVAERLKDPHFQCPCLYVYDGYPGGTGLAEGFQRNVQPILRGARELVEHCACSEGCPSCIGPTEGRLLFNPKEAVVRFFAGVLTEAS